MGGGLRECGGKTRCHGFLQGFSFEEAIICGVAAGAANTLRIGAGQFELEDFERLRGQVRISGKTGE